MAERRTVRFTAEQVAEICAFSDYEAGSDIDSETGGMSSGEEMELDELLCKEIDSEADLGDPSSILPIPASEPSATSSEDNDEVADVQTSNQGKRKRGRKQSGRHFVTRGRGRGRSSRGRGTARNQTRRISSTSGTSSVCGPCKSYDDADTANDLPPFKPKRLPGLHLSRPVTRAMTKAVDFFRLFLTLELIQEIVKHTNAYAWTVIEKKQAYADKWGAWKETSVEEIEKLIAIVLYFGLVHVNTFQDYWSTKTLYHGLWARTFLSRLRFKSLMATLHIVDPSSEDEEDKLRKIASFLEDFKSKCKSLYQPFQKVAVDERMVKSKHRSGIRQYIKNKPTKWGIKLWVIADSTNGYTYDFDVYAGKNAGQEVSPNGLGYDVVMRLVSSLINQGYHLYFDNYYTSVQLVQDLFKLEIPACGTASENRRGFPQSMKNGKQWAKGKERGSMRWEREGGCLALQWLDNRPVTMLSTIDSANSFVLVDRKEKVNNKWCNIKVRQPQAIHSYNQFMNGVDRSDQMLAQNSTLRKCMRWWKTLFFHMIDIAVVNSFILFQLHRAEHPEVEELKRPSRYSASDFREELVRQLGGLEEYGLPPVWKPSAQEKPKDSSFQTEHVLEYTDEKRNCRVCWATEKIQRQINSYCSAPQCQVYLHSTKNRNCFRIWHSKDFSHK